jgi:hypothetical protein
MPGCEGLKRLPACIPADPRRDGETERFGPLPAARSYPAPGGPEEFVPAAGERTSDRDPGAGRPVHGTEARGQEEPFLSS